MARRKKGKDAGLGDRAEFGTQILPGNIGGKTFGKQYSQPSDANLAGTGDRLRSAFGDGDLVGSENTIEEFDGNQFSAGGAESVGGAGGGTGSALLGRESVGRVGQIEGQSMEDVVYGVEKRGRKVRRPRGE